MGFFDKKTCGLCGGKVGMMRKLTLSDTTLCADCRDKTSALVPKSTWKKSTLDDLRRHLEHRERNRGRFAAFTETGSAGGVGRGGGILRVDERQGQFFFATGRDWKADNPEVFDVAAFRGLAIEPVFDSSSDDRAGDGVPDHLQQARMGGIRAGGVRSGGVHAGNLMQYANTMPFGRHLRGGSFGHDPGGMPREVTGFRFTVELNDPMIPEVTWSDTSMDGREIQAAMVRANQITDMCDRIRGMAGFGGAPQGQMPGHMPGHMPGQGAGGYGAPGYGGRPQQQGYQQGYAQQGYQQSPPPGYPPQGQPGQGAAPAPGFCSGCGNPLAPDARFCTNCGQPA
ncbi:MAG TPA: DUF4428 domain-containing protein [Corynebacterium sp.]|uniref:DUF4428 domain-containing protein n=1 Tax=Corynebacterium sp. TaxID=1720 RepID=UPI0018296FBA|nr:DUF4428 domain-containing protein [Corynebacterium sp.]HHT32027.1 DUF4428 domain-containing protein [Corynebacterium sp.]